MGRQGRVKEIKDNLNSNQLHFCELFVSSDKEFFGNGVQSYIESYEPDQTRPNWYKNACSRASELLSNPKVMAKISSLLEVGGFNDENVEKQHTFLINQYTDLGVKQRALSDFYKLKGKYAPEKSVIEVVNRDEVEKRLANLRK